MSVNLATLVSHHPLAVSFTALGSQMDPLGEWRPGVLPPWLLIPDEGLLRDIQQSLSNTRIFTSWSSEVWKHCTALWHSIWSHVQNKRHRNVRNVVLSRLWGGLSFTVWELQQEAELHLVRPPWRCVHQVTQSACLSPHMHVPERLQLLSQGVKSTKVMCKLTNTESENNEDRLC